MPQGWGGSPSDDWNSFVVSKLAELTQLRQQMLNVATPKEAQVIRSQMQAVIVEINQSGQTWASTGLSSEYRNAYREGGSTGPIPKVARDQAYRNRLRSKKAVNRLNTNLNQWTNSEFERINIEKFLVKARALEAKLARQIPGLKGDAKIEAMRNRLALQDQIKEQQKIERRYRIEEDPKVIYHANKKTASGLIRGSDRSYVPASAYTEMVARTGHAMQTNQGFIHGLMAAGKRQTVYVSDGPDCGWRSHPDRDKAHGKRVTLDEALAHPQAHPNCSRQFQLEKPDPHKKATTKVANTFRQLSKGVKEAGKGVDVSWREPKAASAWLRYATIAGSLVNAGVILQKSPFIKYVVNQAVNNGIYPLPNIMKDLLGRFAGFVFKEKQAMNLFAEKLGLQTVEDLRDRVQHDIDEIFVSTADQPMSTTVKVPDHVRRTLGVGPRITKDELYSNYKIYNDHVQYQRGPDLDFVDAIEEARTTAIVRERVSDLGRAALDLHTIPARGQILPKKLSDILKNAHAIPAADPDFFRREGFRTIAQLTPFGRLNITGPLGKLKMTIGTSQAGRANIATKLYDLAAQVKGHRPRWSADDLAWAKRIGITLPEKIQITRQDFVNALLPRITWEPFKAVQATVLMRDGNVIPLIKVFPPGALRKWASADARLRSDYIGNFLADVRAAKTDGRYSKQWLAERILKGDGTTGSMLDETIINLDFLRRGPFHANMRFYGTDLDSYGVLVQPDNDMFRIRWRILRQIRSRDAQYIQSEFVVLPASSGGLKLSYSHDQANLTLAKYHAWRGNLMEIHKAFRISYEDLVEWSIEARKRWGNYWEELTRADWRHIRTWEDLSNTLNRLKHGDDLSLLERNRGLDVSRKGTLDEDIKVIQDTISNEFPKLRQYPIRIVDDADAPFDLYFDEQKKFIGVRRTVADTWNEHYRLRRRGVTTGWFPAGTYERASSLAHEIGHNAAQEMTVDEYRGLWTAVGNKITWPRTSGIWKYTDENGVYRVSKLNREEWLLARREGRLLEQLEGPRDFPHDEIRLARTKADINRAISLWMGAYDNKLRPIDRPVARKISSKVSGYSTHGPQEMLAEAFTEYVTSARPREVARVVGDYFKRIYGGGLQVVP